MAEIEIDLTSITNDVDFYPASQTAEIIQNVRTLLRTRVGTVPLDREFGLSWDFVDLPLPVGQARLSAEVIQKVRRYEPRATVVSVEFAASSTVEGQTRPRIVIGVNAE